MFNIDEIIIDGVLYRRVEDKIEDRPINFNPFDISEKDEVFLFPNLPTWILIVAIIVFMLVLL